jgi:hypothetical protein
LTFVPEQPWRPLEGCEETLQRPQCFRRRDIPRRRVFINLAIRQTVLDAPLCRTTVIRCARGGRPRKYHAILMKKAWQNASNDVSFVHILEGAISMRTTLNLSE